MTRTASATSRRPARQRIAIASVLALVAAGIALTSRLTSPATGSRPRRQRSPGPAPLIPGSARDFGPTNPSQPVTVMLRVAGGGADRAATALAASIDTQPPLDLPAFSREYGPPAAAVNALRRVLAARGVQATSAPGDWWLVTSGAASSIEHLFTVGIDDYRAADGSRFYAAGSAPSLPASLRGLADEIGPIDSAGRLQPAAVPAGGLTADGLLEAYDVTPLRQRGYSGTGRAVILLESDAYSQSDLDAFTAQLDLPPLRPQNHLVFTPAPAVAGEATMDLEVVHEMAPRSPLIVYTAGGQPQSESDLLNTLYMTASRMVDDNPGAIISMSLGLCEPVFGNSADAWNNLFAKAADLGETVFASSGDDGAYGCMGYNDTGPTSGDTGVQIPASLVGVTGVGGTRLNVREDGTYLDEQVWEYPADIIGSGGGRSIDFGRPTWQFGPGLGVPAPGDTREVPDVAGDADPATGAQIVEDGQAQTGGGTSQATPMWAGITALIDQYLVANHQPPVGFFNPILYSLARSHPPLPPFHDITVGSNLMYPTTPGYDMATGLGSPDAWNLAQDIGALNRGTAAP